MVVPSEGVHIRRREEVARGMHLRCRRIVSKVDYSPDPIQPVEKTSQASEAYNPRGRKQEHEDLGGIIDEKA